MSQPTAREIPPFTFPREYHFPPFFTRQTNLTTHHAQLTKWSSLILSFCQHYRIHRLSLSQFTTTATSSTATSSSLTSSSSAAPLETLFHNPTINRRLSTADIKDVIDFMRKQGRVESYAPTGANGDGGKDVVWVYWRTPEEWAEIVERWVDETAQRGVVLTVYEITEGETCRGTEFYGLDQELMMKALQVLVKRGRAQIFGQEDSQGVKFF
ncbi:ESCRT-II complex subunit [Scedosporium apiospermum]|uniref:ESCRT-II complex subunit VPS25 n=1 Tax=Pseudallescheria apiosperma TaxID=563466 RepID=A0A084FZ44_PSEDA|nr:ESCRT-II complex subunit [Scedosporium apiospermum]KEZ40356.1 ESCRT-II complex subunit [Scedosporium apiospermum]